MLTLNKKEIITNFSLSTMNVKIITQSSLSQEESVKQHMSDFNTMSAVFKKYMSATIANIDAILNDLSSIESLKSVEITNPNNKNGFIFYFE
jgi:hypothetical protein